MANTVIKTGPINQNSCVVIDHAEAYSPFFVNGGVISQEFLLNDADPSKGFAPSDDLIIQIPAATAITFAEFQTATGVKIAHTIADISGSTGKQLTVAIGANEVIRCLILYRV